MSFVSWLWAHVQFNFYISFLCSAMYYIALLLTVAKNEFARWWHIKYNVLQVHSTIHLESLRLEVSKTIS